MEGGSEETILFEKCIVRLNKVLRVVGMTLDEDDMERSFIQRLRRRWFFCFNCLWFNNDVILEMAWLFNTLFVGTSMMQITYFMPCITLCLYGDLRTYYFMKHAHEVNGVVKTLKKLQASANEMGISRNEFEEDMKKQMPKLSFATYSLWYCNLFGLLTFALGPFVIIGLNYRETGVIELVLPFFVWYPFDATDIRYWPFVYIHQMWSAVMAIMTVVGPENYYSMCCTFIYLQFRCLKYDIETLPMQKVDPTNKTADKMFSEHLVKIIQRHRELIRCVNMMETIFSKSTLFNAGTSSLLICVSGFNVTTMDNYILMVPFLGFLSMGLFQIYLLCNYGDLVMKSSMDIGDAVYNSQWYVANSSVMRDMLILSMRSRRPCKLTANGFSDINLSTYCRIMGSAWSYFTLLKTVYK